MGVAFGTNRELSAREGEALDLSVRLEVDRWNGAVQPRVVLRELYPLGEAPEADGGDPGTAEDGTGCGSSGCPAGGEEWWSRFARALEGFDGSWPPAPRAPLAHGQRSREIVDRRRGATVAALAELVSSGESVLALCADASRRRDLAASAVDPRRFGGASPRVACCRCAEDALDRALGEAEAPVGLALADWGALAQRPAAAAGFRHVVLIDPPPFERLEALARLSRPGGGPFEAGFLHLAWGASEVELAERCLSFEWQPRGAIEQIWRVLSKTGGEAEGEALRSLLAGPGHHPRSPEVAARCVRVLTELGLCEWRPDRAAPTLRVLSSERTELERSRAYAACVARHQEATRFLRNRAQT
jgi:single-stranded-DNA-specific exonuclease